MQRNVAVRTAAMPRVRTERIKLIMLRGELTSPPVLAATVRESAALVAVRTYNVLTVLARQNNTLCCFENTLLVVVAGIILSNFPLLSVATIVISSVRMWYNEIGQKAK